MKLRTVAKPLLFLTFVAELVQACDCVPPQSPQARLDEATAVFSGTVLKTMVSSAPHLTKTYRFQIHQVFKGQSQSEILLDHRASKNCGFTFETGGSYLVYAYGKPGALTANICSATQKLSTAHDEIKALQTIAAKPTVPVGEAHGYFLRDNATGTLHLKAREFTMRGPITFELREVWRFDPKTDRWRQEPFAPSAPKRVVRGTRQVYGSASDTTITAVTNELGLFWVKWIENQATFEGFAYSGLLCNDVHLGQPPNGFVAACVPFADHAEARFVPDPKIHCVGPESTER